MDGEIILNINALKGWKVGVDLGDEMGGVLATRREKSLENASLKGVRAPLAPSLPQRAKIMFYAESSGPAILAPDWT